MPRRTWGGSVAVYAAGIGACVLLLVWAFQLWRADLAVPLVYRGGDQLYFNTLVKTLFDTGWVFENPFIGAPGNFLLHDFPRSDSLHFLLIKCIGLCVHNPAATLNVFFLMTFPLTVITSLFVFRRFNISAPAALFGSVLYAFMPYHFSRGEGHLFLSAYYLLPLMIMICLWLAGGEVSLARTGRLFGCIGICALTASGGVYYAFFAGYLLAAAGLCAVIRQKNYKPAVTTLVLLVVLFSAVVVNMSPSIRYRIRHGPNPAAAVRSPEEADLYGLKIAQLLLPSSDHRVPFMSRLKTAYYPPARPVNETESAALGLIGSAGFLVLIGWLVKNVSHSPSTALLTRLSHLNLAAVLLGVTGGLGSLFALLVSPQIRAYNRISIYIAFLSVFAVVTFLDWLWQRFATSQPRRCMFGAGLAVLTIAGVADQARLRAVPRYEQNARDFRNDAAFVARVESAVPAQTMIFQLPYVQFPESPLVHCMADYEHFRGYLHSKTLRWSYGTMKGRAADDWQRQTAALPAPELIDKLWVAGFRGIWLDRRGYPNRALEEQLTRTLGNPIISDDERLLFYPMLQPLDARGTAATPPTQTEAQHLNLCGWIDLANCSTIAGWAWNRDLPQGPVTVDIYLGHDLLASVRADQFRADLLAGGTGDGRYGFVYVVPPDRVPDGLEVIRAKIAGTDYELNASPACIVCEPR